MIALKFCARGKARPPDMAVSAQVIELHNFRTVLCRSCSKPIIFMKTRLGKRMPTNAESVAPADLVFDASKHVSHYATCPHANSHRKPR